MTFGDVTLGPGEFLAGGYSNFLFSFKEMGAMPMENSVTLLAPFCDDAAVDRPAAELPLLAPTFMLGWNPNKHLELSACPALLDMVFHSLVPEVDAGDTSTTIASGVVGHRSCASMDVTGVTVPVPYARTVDPASFETGCSGIQLALPAPTFRSDGMSAMQGMEQPALTCDDVVVTMTSDGLRISFVDGALKLCPGCFLVGGPDNVMASWRTLDGSDASLIPIGPPAMPYCGAGPDMSLTAEVGPVTPCNAEENAELDGEVLNGGTFLTSSAGACCLACQENPGCNVWTFCTDEGGCGGAAPTYSYSRCSLKYQDPAQLSPGPAPGKRGPEITFTSGSLPEKETEIFVADTVQQIRNETGETCAVCQIEDAANYKGDPLIDGTNLLVDSPEACCAKCAEDDRCNSFVYCGSESGCGGEYYDYKHRECWLKFLAEDMWTQFPVPAWNRGDGVPWTSGIVNRTRCVERVFPPPSPPAIVTIPLPQPPPPSPEQPSPVRTAPTTCAEGASSIAELCTGVLLGQEESLEVDDASECCGVITWMNADERRCFCDSGVVASLGRLADPLLLVGGIVCEVEILSGDACAPAPTPTPAPVPEPSAPEPPPPDAPTQPTPAPGPPLPGAPPAPVVVPQPDAPAPPPPDAPDAPAPPPPDAPDAPAPPPPDTGRRHRRLPTHRAPAPPPRRTGRGTTAAQRTGRRHRRRPTHHRHRARRRPTHHRHRARRRPTHRPPAPPPNAPPTAAAQRTSAPARRRPTTGQRPTASRRTAGTEFAASRRTAGTSSPPPSPERRRRVAASSRRRLLAAAATRHRARRHRMLQLRHRHRRLTHRRLRAHRPPEPRLLHRLRRRTLPSRSCVHLQFLFRSPRASCSSRVSPNNAPRCWETTRARR